MNFYKLSHNSHKYRTPIDFGVFTLRARAYRTAKERGAPGFHSRTGVVSLSPTCDMARRPVHAHSPPFPLKPLWKTPGNTPLRIIEGKPSWDSVQMVLLFYTVSLYWWIIFSFASARIQLLTIKLPNGYTEFEIKICKVFEFRVS